MRSTRWGGFTLALVILLLSGCSGGGGSIAPMAPTAISYTASSAVYVKDVAITPDTPTSSGGSVTSWSVSPALPAGLALSTTTGIVTGTPSVVTAAATYTVTATGAGGSTTATLSITVSDQAPATFSYAAGTATYTVGEPITPNGPTNSGGAVVSYSVNPTLPRGPEHQPRHRRHYRRPDCCIGRDQLHSHGHELRRQCDRISDHRGQLRHAVASVSPGRSGLSACPARPCIQWDRQSRKTTPPAPGERRSPISIRPEFPFPAYSISPSLPLGLCLSSEPAHARGQWHGCHQRSAAGRRRRTTTVHDHGIQCGWQHHGGLTLTVNGANVSPAGLAYNFPAPVYAIGYRNYPGRAGGNSTISSTAPGASTRILPPDLSFDTSTGIVTGTPADVRSNIPPASPTTVSHPQATSRYRHNATGSTTAPLTITIYHSPQAVPNLAQSITPPAIPGSSFQFLDTGMTVTDSFNPQSGAGRVDGGAGSQHFGESLTAIRCWF